MTDTAPGTFPDPGLPLSDRVTDLLGPAHPRREDRRCCTSTRPPSPGSGVGPFRTGTEALHGLAWLGPATVFPQAVGLASTWNPDLVAAGRRGGRRRGARAAPQGPGRGPASTCGRRWSTRCATRAGAATRRATPRTRGSPACIATAYAGRAARRPPPLPAHRADAQALPRLQQRDRPLPHVQRPAAAGAARVRAAGLPGADRGRRGGRRDGLVQPGQRPAGAPQPADRRRPARLAGRRPPGGRRRRRRHQHRRRAGLPARPRRRASRAALRAGIDSFTEDDADSGADRSPGSPRRSTAA